MFLTTGDDDDGGEAADISIGEPVTVPEDELRAFGRAQAVPVYWAGPRRGSAYELTRTADGRVFIRYLPEGADPGDPRPRFLTVASYAQPNAYRFLRSQSRRRSWAGQTTGGGALVAYPDSRPTSVSSPSPTRTCRSRSSTPTWVRPASWCSPARFAACSSNGGRRQRFPESGRR